MLSLRVRKKYKNRKKFTKMNKNIDKKWKKEYNSYEAHKLHKKKRGMTNVKSSFLAGTDTV